MFLGWIVGIAPPGRIMDLVGAGRFLSTMLKAHVAAYRAIKAMPGGAAAQVGRSGEGRCRQACGVT